MPKTITATDTPIRRGIKSVGVGKKGSTNLEPELIGEILNDFKAGSITPAQKGAFFAGLLFKGITPAENILEEVFIPGIFADPKKLADALSSDAPEFVQKICADILDKKELDQATAEKLGDFLFSNLPGDDARGLVAVALRVRYETADEYAGLLKSIDKTIVLSFRQPIPVGEPIIQLADPFDGVDHSFSITPLLAMRLQKDGYRVISVTGRNSGPKFGNNLLNLAHGLKQAFAKSNQDLGNSKPALGWVIDQKDLSSALDRWVELRQQIIKRPFLATIERFVNPCSAKILIASAFHPPYGEKMLEVGERAGFPQVIIIRNGMEGTIAFPLKRAAKILCSARQASGQYIRTELEFNSKEFLNWEPEMEERQDNPSLDENVRLIQEFAEKEKTNNKLFDQRIKVTYAGLKQAFDWLESKKG